MAWKPETLHDLTPGVDRFPAAFIPEIREGLDRNVVGVGMMADSLGMCLAVPAGGENDWRWGTLDDDLDAGSYATVSLFIGTDGDWNNPQIDSGDNWEYCYAPFVLKTGTVVAGKRVGVRDFGTRKIVLLHEC